MKLDMQLGLSPGHIVLDGNPAIPPQRATALPRQFSAHICCGQMPGWIKTPLGREVGLDPSDIVLDGDPIPLSQKRGRAPNFRPMYIVAKRLGDQDATWYHGGRLRPRPHCVMGIQLPQKGYSPQFSAYVYCGQTVAHLGYC